MSDSQKGTHKRGMSQIILEPYDTRVTSLHRVVRSACRHSRKQTQRVLQLSAVVYQEVDSQGRCLKRQRARQG